MRDSLKSYIDSTRPQVLGDANLNDFTERIQPLKVGFEIASKEWAVDEPNPRRHDSVVTKMPASKLETGMTVYT